MSYNPIRDTSSPSRGRFVVPQTCACYGQHVIIDLCPILHVWTPTPQLGPLHHTTPFPPRIITFSPPPPNLLLA